MLIASRSKILEGKTEYSYKSKMSKDLEEDRWSSGVRHGDAIAGEGVKQKYVKTKQKSMHIECGKVAEVATSSQRACRSN